jgi:hypothetical protein
MELLPVPAAGHPSAYEQQALNEIRLWKERDQNWFGRSVEVFNRAFHAVTDLVRKVPGVDWTIDNVVAGLLRLTNEMVQDTVWRDAIYKEFQRAGHPVQDLADIHRMDLEAVDRAQKGLDTKYRALAAVEGAATGIAGAAGIVPDIVALVALNLRAAGEYATYYGFDIAAPEERLFALQILNAVSAPSDVSKQVALTPVLRVSRHIARDQTLLAVEQFAITRAIRNAVQALGLHLTRAKLAQLVPMTGAVVGSGFNAYYTSKVCDAAAFLYRERFLIRKYGPGV